MSTVIRGNDNFDTSDILANVSFDGDGIEYSDVSLIGTPDTNFSSTGSKIYKDGTIIGKSSNGVHIKYPNGEAEWMLTTTISYPTTSSYGTCYHGVNDTDIPYSLVFTSVPYVYATRPQVSSGRKWIESVMPTESYIDKIYSISPTSYSSSEPITLLAKGRWK